MKNNKPVLIVAAAILVVGFLVFSLEKLQVINLYSKPVSAPTSTQTRPVNDVDYTPETSPPDASINSEKNPNQTSNSNNTDPQNPVTLTITRANQDPSTKNLNVGVLVEGTKTGTCKLELSQNSTVVVTKTAAVVEQSGLTTCAGFSVLASEIPSSGTYSLKISVGTASTSQKLELKK